MLGQPCLESCLVLARKFRKEAALHCALVLVCGNWEFYIVELFHFDVTNLARATFSRG